jgi:3-deoxy-7-phosphoheptulonate synthase
VRACKAAGRHVLWSCDPMHGNTTTTAGGVKTRDFSQIAAELSAAFEIHRAEGGVLGGVHFELTGDNVTECVGGAEGLGSADLSRSYETGCDPRLNYAQSMEMAFLISALLHQHKGEDPRRNGAW